MTVSLQQLLTVAGAILFGDGVSVDRRQKRVEICGKCPLLSFDPESQVARCSICKCIVSGDRNLINLARYEETDSYGCKHPEGSQWKKNGV